MEGGEDLSWPLERARLLAGDRVAVLDGARAVTYAQLAARVGALGAALEQLDVPVGGRVAFLGVNSLAHVECWLGVPAFGRVLVDLNFRLAVPELAFMVDDCEPAVLVVTPGTLEVGRALRDRCEALRTLVLAGDPDDDTPADCLGYEAMLGGASPLAPPGVAVDAMAAISYTGGTTGRPKGVILTHGNLLANARHNLIATGHSEDDVWLHVCPMFHVAGTANVLACTWVGARQVILPRFDAEAVIAVIDGHAITHVVLVPTMLAMLLEGLERRPSALASLRHVQYAASPISPDLQARVLDVLECDVAQFYGMTEAAPTVTTLSPRDHRRGAAGEAPWDGRLRSLGVPVVGVRAEVRAADGAPVAPGEIGEVWVRGPNVMAGYWHRPEVTAEVLRDGWYRTGDAGYADGGGYLYLVDRLKDMIITGGENVYCIEVEATLLDHPAVAEAAVFGIPDPRWGEAVHAVVGLAPGAEVSGGELIAFCRERIAGYKAPRSIDVAPGSLPKSGAGKLLKNVLREPFWEDRERRVN
jgi:long-chain acyl-CoA synthetase